MFSYFSHFTGVVFLGFALSTALPVGFGLVCHSLFFCQFGRVEGLMLIFYKQVLGGISSLAASRKAGSFHFLSFLFFNLLVVNYCGLIPFCYCISAEPFFIFSLVILFWGMGSFPVLSNPVRVYNSFTIEGVHAVLNSLVFLSEWISWLLRPLVLGIRIVVNVACGHVLLGVFSQLSCGSLREGSLFVFFITLVCLVFVLGLEIVVVGVQAYVFSMIVALTWGETFYSGAFDAKVHMVQGVAYVARGATYVARGVCFFKAYWSRFWLKVVFFGGEVNRIYWAVVGPLLRGYTALKSKWQSKGKRGW